MSLNDRVFASLSKILDEWAAAHDEILLQAHRVISITRETHAIQLFYWINSSIRDHIYIYMQMGKKSVCLSMIEWFYYYIVDKYDY